jgi:RimJ/RimL family protein N-acetyltransferase
VGRPGSLTVEGARPGLTLRAARVEDASLIRAWRNDPDAVRFSTSARTVSDAEHARWFSATLVDPRSRLWVAEEDGVPVGQVRVDVDGDAGVFSIAVAPAARGRGVGQEMLRSALGEIEREHLVTTITAESHPDNQASMHAFERVGFRRRGASEGGFIVLELRLG